jgi:cytochrome P450
MPTNSRHPTPGPKALPLVGLLPAFRKDPLALLTSLQGEHGDLFTLPLGPYRFLVVNNADHIHTILTRHGRGFAKGRDARLAAPLLGEGLLLSEGEPWRRQRRLVRPAFGAEQLQRYADVMSRVAERVVTRWHDGQTLDLDEAMSHIALSVAIGSFFGGEAEDALPEINAYVQTARRFLIDRFRSLVRLPVSWPLPTHRTFRAAVRGLGQVIERLVHARRASGAQTEDFLGRLLRDLDDPESPMDQTELRDHAISFLIAGSETTAATMAFAWYLLATHPEADRQLCVELEHTLGGRAPTVADLPGLAFLRSVVLETLRLYPPVWLFVRAATAPFALGRYEVAANAQVMISPWLSHRTSASFEDPEAFRPERWSTGAEPAAFIPFGGGPRLCIGREFAMMEAVLVIAHLRARARFQLLKPWAVEPEALLTLRPRGGIPVRVRLPASESVPC